ncbi:MAG: hypothetical protein B6242_17470 [Anaerolineaceae bacterium 4572_78]|nr:MAG: hypothetical protein B6242_17470 [Anaerolineaceae bacterium 4572_78]
MSTIYQSNFSELYHVTESSRKIKAQKTLAVIKDAYAQKLLDCLVLEIGCQSGRISIPLAISGLDLVAIDIDISAIQKGNQQEKPNNLKFMVTNAERMTFQDETFDIVICSHIYEHVPYPKIMMKEIYRVLKPNGLCYFAGGNRTKIIEPHHKLPFLSWLPKPFAHYYLRVSGKGNYYYENLLFHHQLKDLVKDFVIVDYTEKILDDPSRFYANDMLTENSPKHKISKLFYSYFKPLFPTFIWIIMKK